MNADLIELYRQLHQQKPGYGSSASYLEHITALIKARNVRSVLDFGCGKGTLLNHLRQRFPDLVVDGYDPAIPGMERIPREQYDMVIANDVLEHLDPGNYQQDLAAIQRLNPQWLFFWISCRPAVNLLPDGQNCHTIVQSPQWWRAALENCFPGFIEHDSQWVENAKGWMFTMTKPLDVTGKRVAIVGNAPQAMSNTEDIDSFDYVVRFNNFAVGEGFEAVGTRTDILAIPVCNRYVITDKLRRFTGNTHYVLDLATNPPSKAYKYYPTVRRMLPHATINQAHEYALRVWPQLSSGRLPPKRGLVPSTGISAIAWAMASGASEVYLTGFSFQKTPVSHYFHAHEPGHKMASCHDLIRELKWLADRRDHPGLKLDAHITAKVDEWVEAYLRLGSAKSAYFHLSGIPDIGKLATPAR